VGNFGADGISQIIFDAVVDGGAREKRRALVGRSEKFVSYDIFSSRRLAPVFSDGRLGTKELGQMGTPVGIPGSTASALFRPAPFLRRLPAAGYLHVRGNIAGIAGLLFPFHRGREGVVSTFDNLACMWKLRSFDFILKSLYMFLAIGLCYIGFAVIQGAWFHRAARDARLDGGWEFWQSSVGDRIPRAAKQSRDRELLRRRGRKRSWNCDSAVSRSRSPPRRGLPFAAFTFADS
jgi:hypothetical protein